MAIQYKYGDLEALSKFASEICVDKKFNVIYAVTVQFNVVCSL